MFSTWDQICPAFWGLYVYNNTSKYYLVWVFLLNFCYRYDQHNPWREGVLYRMCSLLPKHQHHRPLNFPPNRQLSCFLANWIHVDQLHRIGPWKQIYRWIYRVESLLREQVSYHTPAFLGLYVHNNTSKYYWVWLFFVKLLLQVW